MGPTRRMHRRESIQRQADHARRIHWPSGTLPVDIDLILERHGVDIIPVANLRREAGVEACISADLSCVYLDLEYSRDERMNSRVRFSLAHEFGHMILHPEVFEVYRAHNPGSVLNWARHIKERFDTELLEREANEFAACFLVPCDELQSRYDELLPAVRTKLSDSGIELAQMDSETLYGYMANAICRAFEVSAKVVAIRLERINARAQGDR